jgi:hypothetical protein
MRSARPSRSLQPDEVPRRAVGPNGQPVTVCFDAALAGSMSFADADVLEGVEFGARMH